jgi:sortase A
MQKKLILRVASVSSGVLGLGILVYVLSPIIFYEYRAARDYPKLLNPVVEKRENTLGSIKEDSDFTKASNWFPGAKKAEEFETSGVAFYTISIPRLKIDNATVGVGGEDLSKSLIQYPGTALPGKSGNTVIFGHSILPQFFNPKDYLAIFSTLPQLKKGDEITINYDGITYKFRVETLFEVAPTDLEVLEQRYSEPYLSLVTCVPPGHPLKPRRLIVRAKIVPFN